MLKSVMVWGARQDTGFELCSQLLDNGFQVLGVDHSGWQRPEHEDRWMLIGRNANLQYIEREEWDPSSIEKCHFMIFPLNDYHRNGDDDTFSELLADLVKLKESSTERLFIFIEPSSNENEKWQTDLVGKVDELMKAKLQNVQIRRYRSGQDGVAILSTEEGDTWRRLADHPCNPIDLIISDLLELDSV